MSGSSWHYPMVLTFKASNSGDGARLRAALDEIAANEPDISITARPGSVYSLYGNSKSQLESICDRVAGVNVTPIKAVFLETIRIQAEAEGKYIRQTGGRGNYGYCRIRIQPNDPAKGYVFINAIPGDAIPDQYINSIDDGIQEAMKRGILAGYPVVDVKVTLYDGSFHEADSNQLAFKFAGSIAFHESARKASPVLLEPVMALEIDVPEEMTTSIYREVRLHRGRIESESAVNGFTEIKAIVPLSELLVSSSLGSSEIPMEFAGYEPVSDDDPSTDRDSRVTANKPNPPRPRQRSGDARPEPDDE